MHCISVSLPRLLLTLLSNRDKHKMGKEVLLPPSEYLYHAKTYEDLAEQLKDDNKIRVAGIDVDGVLRGKVRYPSMARCS